MDKSKKLTLSEKILAGLDGLIFLLLLLQVFSRYIFGRSLSFTEEVARLLFIWAVFLGAVESFKRNEHIKIDALFNVLPEKLRQVIKVITFIITGATLILLIISGVNVVKTTSLSSMITVPIPTSSLYLIVPLASVIMLFYMVETVISWLKKKGGR